MNVVERAPAQGTSRPAEPPPPVADAPPPAQPSPRVPKLTPLLSLLPYVGRYRGRALAALAALLVAALATLAVPLAVRRMIDFGFSREGLNLIDSYFAVMIAVAGVLAVASAAALLPRHHARRAHRRRPAQRRVQPSHRALGRLFRPGQDRRDALAAHRRHHPDQVRGRRVGVGRAAQSRAVRRRHRHDGDHQPAAVAVRARSRSR